MNHDPEKDPIEQELAALFDATAAELESHAHTRLKAKAVDVPDKVRARSWLSWLWWSPVAAGAVAAAAIAVVVAAPNFLTTALAARFPRMAASVPLPPAQSPRSTVPATVSPAPVTSNTSVLLNAGISVILPSFSNKTIPSPPRVRSTLHTCVISSKSCPAFSNVFLSCIL